MPKGDHLSGKQQRFVTEYLIDLNAREAAIRAGYSLQTAHSIGFENLKKPAIAAAIQAAMDEHAQATDVTVERVLREIATIGYSDVTHYVVDDETNQLKLAAHAPRHAMRAISSVKRKTRTIPQKDGPPIVERELEFRLWDKNTALTNLGKHLRLFIDRIELVGPMLEEIKRLAQQQGLSVEEVLAEAEAIAAGRA